MSGNTAELLTRGQGKLFRTELAGTPERSSLSPAMARTRGLRSLGLNAITL